MNVIQAKDVGKSSLREKTDVVVIGSGAGGAIMAYELAAAGKKVILLEAGPYVPSSEFNEVYADMFERLYVDAVAQANTDGDITITQGSLLGGSTVVTACVCFRIPDWVLKHWKEDHGVEGMSPAELAPKCERVEKNLSIHVNEPQEINWNSQLLRKGCEALGWSSKPTPRNTQDCVLAGYCVAGCRYDRKKSTLVTYVPWAIEKGARAYVDTRVKEIRVSGGRATGVGAVIRDPKTKKEVARLDVESQVVVLAAGAVQSPLLLLDNQIANSSAQVGRNFACHPSLNVAALFDEEVNGWVGAVQGVYCDEFGSEEKGGFILEGAAGNPYLCNGFMLPGIGAESAGLAKNVKHLSNTIILIHDQNVGRVHRQNGVKKIEYRVAESDKVRMRAAIKAAARIWFAAGARKVILPTIVPHFLESENDLGVIDTMPMGPGDLIMVSYHPQGTCRMGGDPARSVVNSHGQCHDIPNLVIADASVFPTSVMVNTQMPVYTVATHFADLMNAEPELYFG
jgi:choline dehydrogenase-like flavoprotein